jgi:hypothetical protein
MDDLDKTQEANWTKTVDVFIQVNITKINDIDTVNQRFQAEAIIESKWYDPSITSIHDTIDPNKIWKPELYIENAINDVKEDTRYRVVVGGDSNSHLMVCEIRKVKGLFWEKLELENFPLDTQDLTLIIATKKSGSRVNFVLMQPQVHSLNINNTLDNSMWRLHNVVTTNKSKLNCEFSFGKREYPLISVKVQAFRSPGFFYWNAVLPIFLITLASLGPFVIDYKLPQSRLPSTATMLLTSVSFRWIVGRLLPTVSYLTSLDKYSLVSMMIITFQLFYHAIIAAVYHYFSERFIYGVDKLAFIVFFFMILLKQVVFAKWIISCNEIRETLKKQNGMGESNEVEAKKNI